MVAKKNDTSFDIDNAENPVTESTSEPSPLREREDSGSVVKRIGIPVGEDGKIEFSKMREKSLAQLRESIKLAMTTPEGIQALGLAQQQQIQVVSDDFAKNLYGLLGPIEVMIANKTMKIPKQIAERVMPYSDKEKEALAHPTAIVLSKHLPAAVDRFKEEFELATLLIQIHFVKLQTCKAMVEHLNKIKAEAQQKQNSEEKITPPDEENGGIGL